jgi:hypothetical protein
MSVFQICSREVTTEAVLSKRSLPARLNCISTLADAMAKIATILAAVTAYVVALTEPGLAQGTPEQRWACEEDAFKFCGKEIPNVERITACMNKNVKKLSPGCRAQFKRTG